jgi:hypothetical protein
MTAQAPVSTQAALQTASVVADSLERLVARIRRDLDCDAAESPAITDPYWSGVLDDLVAFSEECGRVVTDPHVVKVLDASVHQ